MNSVDQFYRKEYPRMWDEMEAAVRRNPSEYRQYTDMIHGMNPVQVDEMTKQCFKRFVSEGRITLDDFIEAIKGNYGRPYLREIPKD